MAPVWSNCLHRRLRVLSPSFPSLRRSDSHSLGLVTSANAGAKVDHIFFRDIAGSILHDTLGLENRTTLLSHAIIDCVFAFFETQVAIRLFSKHPLFRSIHSIHQGFNSRVFLRFFLGPRAQTVPLFNQFGVLSNEIPVLKFAITLEQIWLLRRKVVKLWLNFQTVFQQLLKVKVFHAHFFLRNDHWFQVSWFRMRNRGHLQVLRHQTFSVNRRRWSWSCLGRIFWLIAHPAKGFRSRLLLHFVELSQVPLRMLIWLLLFALACAFLLNLTDFGRIHCWVFEVYTLYGFLQIYRHGIFVPLHDVLKGCPWWSFLLVSIGGV